MEGHKAIAAACKFTQLLQNSPREYFALLSAFKRGLGHYVESCMDRARSAAQDAHLSIYQA
jgi:hypothetical protein